MNNLHGILFAYRSNPNLKELTSVRTLASLPFGGRYRLIDFMLSNLVNAGVTDVGVIMHESYQSLLAHLGSGKDWDLSRKHGGLKLLPPFAFSEKESHVQSRSRYRGSMEALNGCYSYLRDIRQEYVLLADAHIVVSLPVEKILRAHIDSGADITAVCTTQPKADPQDSTYFNVNRENRVVDVAVRPSYPSGLESLNIYILSKELLLKLTEYCAARDIYSFPAGVLLPMKDELNIQPYLFDDYAIRLQDVSGYFAHSMDMLDPQVRQRLFRPENPIRTKDRSDPATYYDPQSAVNHSVVADGCVIRGTVQNCVIFHGVQIGSGALVRNCIIMPNTVIRERADLRYVIADKDVEFSPGVRLMGAPSYPICVEKGVKV